MLRLAVNAVERSTSLVFTGVRRGIDFAERRAEQARDRTDRVDPPTGESPPANEE